MTYPINVFKIKEMSVDGSVTLVGYDHPLSISEIEAIKIDGAQDREIYYAPNISASVVPYDSSAPVMSDHSGEYYMDGLNNNKYNNKTVKQLVLDADCRYVHEVQHLLRKIFGTDDLRVDK